MKPVSSSSASSSSKSSQPPANTAKSVKSTAKKAVVEDKTELEDRPEEWTNKRASEQALRAATARQVSGRRRFVDPTTCERDYSDEEMEFMYAMQEYKKSSGRNFPTWSEILEVLRDLGYEKPNASVEPVATSPKGMKVASA